jgi:hypothetical protein
MNAVIELMQEEEEEGEGEGGEWGLREEGGNDEDETGADGT